MTDFHEIRRTGIGGSDIGVLLGVNPYKTKLELYLEKRGEIDPQPDNAATQWGRAQESVIAAFAEARTGHKLEIVDTPFRHPRHEFLIGHIDRKYSDMARGLEIKNIGRNSERQWGEDGAPDGVAEIYLPQVHHYLLVTDYPVFDVAAYFGGADLRMYTVHRDPEMDQVIIDAASAFWNEHVLPGIPPAPDFDSPTTPALLKRMYTGTNGKTVMADETLRHWARVAQDAAKKAAEYEKVAEIAKAHMLDAMGDAAVLDCGGGLEFRRKLTKRKGYTVPDSEYMDARFGKKKGSNDEQ